MARLAAWAGIALLVAYLLFAGGGWNGIYESRVRTVSVTLAGLALLLWVLAALRDPRWLPRSRLLPALLLALGSLTLSTIVSRDQRVSVEYLGYAVLLVALYLLLVRLLASSFFRERLMALAALLFGLFAAEFIVGIVYLWIQWWSIVGAISVPPLRPYFIGLGYGNPSAVLTLVALLGVAGAFVLPRRWRAPGTAAVVVVVGIVAVLSGSRAGWLALAVAGVAGIALGAVTPFGRALIARRSRVRLSLPSSRRGMALSIGGLVVLVGGLLVLAPALLSRVDAGGEALREGFAVVAIRLFAAAPVLGTGPGTWVVDRLATTQPTEFDYYIPHAHDIPLQTLAELGVVGGIVGVVVVAGALRLVIEGLRGSDDKRRWLSWLTAVALIYFAVHNLLDFYANFPGVLFAAALPVAYLDATSEGSSKLPGFGLARLRLTLPASTSRAGLLAGAAVCAVAVAGLLLQELPASMDERAVIAANGGDWQTAATLANQAVAADPGIHVYQMTAGLAASHLGDMTTAAEDFEVVARADDLPEAWLDLAGSDLALGRNEDASTAVDRAMRLGIQRAVIALPAGDLYLRLGSTDEAIAAFAVALTSNPSLAGDQWWTQSPSRASAYELALERAASSLGPGAWQLWLMAGRSDQARAATTDPAAQRSIAAWDGDASATEALFATCRGHTLDTSTLSWCAAVADHQGDSADASVFRNLEEGIDPGSSESSYRLQVRSTDATNLQSQTYALYWGQYSYRRPTPNDLLIPGLAHLVFG